MYEPAGGDGFGAIFFLFAIAAYLYFGYAQYKIAQKAGHGSPWWAFIPIVNTWQLVEMARKEWYWFVALLVPVVNVICFAILWMEVAQICKKSWFWGLMVLVPFVNFVSIGVLAFGKEETQSFFPPDDDYRRDREPERVG